MLLQAIRDRRRFVQVAPGQWSEIEAGLLERLKAISLVTFEHHGRSELSFAAAPVLEPLAELGATLELSKTWMQQQAKLARARAADYVSHLDRGGTPPWRIRRPIARTASARTSR